MWIRRIFFEGSLGLGNFNDREMVLRELFDGCGPLRSGEGASGQHDILVK